ncbi:MAG: hypothetical protein U5M23_02965 [Marinagarivorans sp.]|nr:hypothetical protein [Marinagarivorans sp.]
MNAVLRGDQPMLTARNLTRHSGAAGAGAGEQDDADVEEPLHRPSF